MADLTKEEQLYAELIATLIAYRAEKGWIIKKAAEEAELDFTVYKRLEKFDTVARTTTVLKAIDALGLKLVLMPKDVDLKLINQFNRSMVQYKKLISEAKELEQ